MKAMPASHARYDASNLEETEFALAISPYPRIEQSSGRCDHASLPSASDGYGRWNQDSKLRIFYNDEVTETLTFGWAISLATAVALVMYVSGG